jgi:transposase
VYPSSSRLLKAPGESIQKANEIVFSLCVEKTKPNAELFGYGSLEERVASNHPLRPMRTMAVEALKPLDGRFDALYDEEGRKSIPPERLLRALLLQMLYSIRSERILLQQLEYNLLYRWFVGMSMNKEVWHPAVFTKNRDRFLEGEIAEEFFSGGVATGVAHTAVGRALHGGRNADRSLGRAEEFPTQG